jgi:hypothetical protein
MLHWSLRLGQFAFSLVLMGCATIGAVWWQRSNDYVDAQLRLLTPLSRSELELANTEGGHLIEGSISPTNPVLAHELVAYEQSRAVRDIRDERVWVPDSKQSPTLIVDLADGPVEIGGDYQLGGKLRTHTDGVTLFAGLGMGDVVVVLGKRQPGAAGVRLDASHVVRGTQAEVLRRGINYWGLGIGGALVVLGLTVMGWLLAQGYSPFGRRQTGRM